MAMVMANKLRHVVRGYAPEVEQQYVLHCGRSNARLRLDVLFFMLQSLGNLALTWRFWNLDTDVISQRVRILVFVAVQAASL
eukprot:9466149-Pyramimonas_sp.AAC.1